MIYFGIKGKSFAQLSGTALKQTAPDDDYRKHANGLSVFDANGSPLTPRIMHDDRVDLLDANGLIVETLRLSEIKSPTLSIALAASISPGVSGTNRLEASRYTTPVFRLELKR